MNTTTEVTFGEFEEFERCVCDSDDSRLIARLAWDAAVNASLAHVREFRDVFGRDNPRADTLVGLVECAVDSLHTPRVPAVPAAADDERDDVL